MTSSHYIVRHWENYSEETVLSTDDIQEVIDYLLTLEYERRDKCYVNGIVGSEWLFDHHTSKQNKTQ